MQQIISQRIIKLVTLRSQTQEMLGPIRQSELHPCEQQTHTHLCVRLAGVLSSQQHDEVMVATITLPKYKVYFFGKK